MFDLKCGDCLDFLKDIPSESVDLVATDCPYHIIASGVSIKPFKECGGILQKRVVSDGTACSNKWIKKDPLNTPCAVKQGKMFDNNDIEFEDWLPDIYRVLKQRTHCYIMVNGRNLKELWQKAEDVGFKFVNLLAWKKNNQTPNKYYMQTLEFILMLRKGKDRYINDMGFSNCLETPNIIGVKNHPTEKPVALMRILVSNSSNEGEVVLDPFMGTGSVGVACKELNRSFIGIEINRRYFDIASYRINGTLTHINSEGMIFD